jgi:hypothetical protein
LEEEED